MEEQGIEQRILSLRLCPTKVLCNGGTLTVPEHGGVQSKVDIFFPSVSYMLNFPAFFVCPEVRSPYKESSRIHYS